MIVRPGRIVRRRRVPELSAVRPAGRVRLGRGSGFAFAGRACVDLGAIATLGVAAILLTGVALGVVYNAFGLAGEPPWGLSWLAEDRLAGLEKVGAPVRRRPGPHASGPGRGRPSASTKPRSTGARSSPPAVVSR